MISLGGNALRLDEFNGGVVGFFWDGGTFQQTVSGGITLAGQGWQHVSYTVDSTNNVQRLYINGSVVGETNFTGDAVFLDTQSRIGAHTSDSSTGFDFNGQIDDARIYTRALSADEVAGLATDQTETTDSAAINIDVVNDAPTFASGDGTEIYSHVASGQDNDFDDVVVLPNGKYLVVGDGNDGSGLDAYVLRYNADGTLDTSFGGGDGVAVLDFGSNVDRATGISSQSDGKIVVIGRTNAGTLDFAIARLTADGVLDSSCLLYTSPSPRDS